MFASPKMHGALSIRKTILFALFKMILEQQRLDHFACLDTLSYKTGISKLRPAGQIRPAKPFHPVREAFSQ